jgi:hypothetical protein
MTCSRVIAVTRSGALQSLSFDRFDDMDRGAVRSARGIGDVLLWTI